MKEHLQDLAEIRSIMERSSKFISLSGWSGIFAGSFALVGAYFAHSHLNETYYNFVNNVTPNTPSTLYLVFLGLSVLAASLLSALYFTLRQSKKTGQKLWGSSSKRMLEALLIPLVTGGLFCAILISKAPYLIDAVTLIFYGLALVNASKYTFSHAKYLGFVQIALGLACGYINEWRFELGFWALGFGVAHIVYGIIMFFQNKENTP